MRTGWTGWESSTTSPRGRSGRCPAPSLPVGTSSSATWTVTTWAGCTPSWRSPRMRKGAAGRRLLAPGALHLDRRIGRTLAIYLVVITVIVGYNARAIADQRGSALSVNVAARQRALAARYEKDVVLTTLGMQADPGADAEQLLANADALLHGGEVLAVQGADEEIHIRPASHDRLVVDKLEEENRLIH